MSAAGLVACSLGRSWRRRRLRAFATLASTIAGISLATVVVGTITSILSAVDDSSGVKLVSADVVVAAGTTSGMSEDTVRSVTEVAGAERALPAVVGSTRVGGDDDAVLTLVGLPPGSSGVRGFDGVTSPGDNSDQLVLAQSFASRHGLGRGETVELSAPTGTDRYLIADIADGDVLNDGAIAITSTADALTTFDRQGFDLVFVVASASTSAGQLVEELSAAAPGTLVGAPDEVAGPERSSFGFVRQLLAMVGVVGLLTAGTVQFVSWRLVIEDERDTIARLRLLGAGRRALLGGTAAILFGVTLVAALVAIPLSLVGVGLMTTFSRQLVSLTGLAATPAAPSPWLPAAAGVGAALVMTVVAWLVGVRSFLRVPAIQAVQGTAPQRLQVRPWMPATAAGLGLLVAAVAIATQAPARVAGGGLVLAVGATIALALGVPVVAGRLIARRGDVASLAAGREFSLGSGRKAGMIGVLSIALFMSFAMMSLATGMSSGLDASVRTWTSGDLYVMPAKPGAALRDERFPASAVDEVEALGSVESVVPFTLSTIKYARSNVQVYSWGREGVEEIVDLNVVEGADGVRLWDRLDAGEVAISENLANLHDLELGGRLELPTASGARSHHIAAIVEDYTGDTGIVFTTASTYTAITGDDRVLDMIVTLSGGTSQEVARAEIAETLDSYPGLIMWTGDEMRQHLLGLLGQVLSILQMIGVICLALSVLVSVTTVIASLPSRQTAVTVSRLIGMSRRQLSRQLLLEASAVAVLAWLIAIPIGVVAVHVIVAAMGSVNGTFWPIEIPVWFAGVLLVAAVAAATLAVFVPSRRLLKLPIGEVSRDD